MKDKLFVVTMTVAVWAKDELDAKDRVEVQLSYSDHAEYAQSEVEEYHPDTKILSIVEKP